MKALKQLEGSIATLLRETFYNYVPSETFEELNFFQ